MSIFKPILRTLCLSIAVLAALHGPARAWSRAGHMVTAAIAYDELSAHHPEVIGRVLEIIAHHPERGPFEVATGVIQGEARDRRLFMEVARWPDDIRGGAYDHPSWHGAFRPIVDPRDPPAKAPPDVVVYEAYEAFALNAHLAADRRAPAADRAVALCWLFHIVGDVHQPLHAGELYSAAFPDGDRYGSLEFLIDPRSGQVVNLHRYWDFLPQEQDTPEAALARARELEARFPRARLAPELAPELTPQLAPAAALDIRAWTGESYALAVSLAYRADRPRAASAADAKRPSAVYDADSAAAAERRLALAGYRLADVLSRVLGGGPD
jgi:hypothetical protein